MSSQEYYPLNIVRGLFEQVRGGAKKVEYVDKAWAIKVYWAGSVIRIDMQEQGEVQGG